MTLWRGRNGSRSMRLLVVLYLESGSREIQVLVFSVSSPSFPILFSPRPQSTGCSHPQSGWVFLIDTLRDVWWVSLNPWKFTVEVNYQRSHLCPGDSVVILGLLHQQDPTQGQGKKESGKLHRRSSLPRARSNTVNICSQLVRTSRVTWPNSKGARSGLFLFCGKEHCAADLRTK